MREVSVRRFGVMPAHDPERTSPVHVPIVPPDVLAGTPFSSTLTEHFAAAHNDESGPVAEPNAAARRPARFGTLNRLGSSVVLAGGMVTPATFTQVNA
jgi:hypothetical protein